MINVTMLDLMELYNEGAITEYEFYSRTRELGKANKLPEEHKIEFEAWSKENPEGGCRTFSITA